MIPIQSIASVDAGATASATLAAGTMSTSNAATLPFGQMLGEGLKQVEQKVAEANNAVRAFALDDSVPIHQVTIALEEARIAVELALQVRTRLVEAYREIMNTQL